MRNPRQEALAAAKACTTKLGGPRYQHSRWVGRGTQVAQANAHARNVLPIVQGIEAAGILTLASIAAAMNAHGVRTARGDLWHPTTVRNLKR